VTKEMAVQWLLRTLWLDYGVALCPEEQPLFGLKLWLLLEEIESEERRRRFRVEPSLN
jgi:hypothetical protein